MPFVPCMPVTIENKSGGPPELEMLPSVIGELLTHFQDALGGEEGCSDILSWKLLVHYDTKPIEKKIKRRVAVIEGTRSADQ